MSINELQILLDLNQDNKAKILEDVSSKMNLGYFFVDSEDGHCYLFDKNGNPDDIKKIKTINEHYVKDDIEKIVIPDSVKGIEDYAFFDCQNLTSINIPNSVQYIEYGAFYYCKNLISIEIPDSVKSIGNFTFKCCYDLTSIKIPDSVKSIGYSAFYECKSLTSIIFENKTIDQIKSMANYPWEIEDESIIKCI